MASFIMATGSGLISGVPDTTNDFKVYGIRNMTDKELYVNVGGPGHVKTKFLDTSDKNAIKVVYVPSKPGLHRIEIKFGGIHIRGSPFKVPVRGRAPPLTLEEKVKPYTYDYVFPLDLYKNVISRSVACVRATGRGLRCGLSGIDNEIVVDARSAAPGRLTYSVSGPGNVDIRNIEFSDGIHRLSYMPHQTGEYQFTIKYAERPIRGSPFTVRVL